MAMKICQTEESMQPDNLLPLKIIAVCLGNCDVHMCDGQRHVDTSVPHSLFRLLQSACAHRHDDTSVPFSLFR